MRHLYLSEVFGLERLQARCLDSISRMFPLSKLKASKFFDYLSLALRYELLHRKIEAFEDKWNNDTKGFIQIISQFRGSCDTSISQLYKKLYNSNAKSKILELF